MGPTNVALVRYFQADQELRAAKARLDAASKDVRVQERRVNDLAEKHRLAQHKLREFQSKAATMELDLKSRDAHIEKLRSQQATTKNNKEYQTFLIEINTQKVDRNKVEDDTMKLLEQVERGNKELIEILAHLDAEKAKLVAMKEQIGGRLAEVQQEVDEIQPKVDAAGAAVAAKARDVFDKLSDRFDGEAMAPIAKPDRRREEYVCTACNMDLVVDIYNKLHSRDELIFCPSCRRLLYIPDDLPPEVAIKGKPAGSGGKKSGASIAKTARGSGPRSRAPGATGNPVVDELTRVLTRAAGESVRNAVAAGNDPIEYEVSLDGKFVGVFKGQSVENLSRTARFCLQEAGIPGTVSVVEKKAAPPVAPDVSAADGPGDESPEVAAQPAESPVPSDSTGDTTGDTTSDSSAGQPASAAQ